MRYALLIVLLLPVMAQTQPYVVNVVSVGTGTRTNTVVTRPAGEQEGDYVILCFKKGDNPAIDGTPTGFTGIYTHNVSTGDDQYWGMWIRKITSSEANSADTIKHTGDNDETTAGSILVRGVDGTDEFDTAWVTANHFLFEENVTSPAVPSIETNNDSSLIITFVGMSQEASTATQPSGHTKAWSEFEAVNNRNAGSHASYVLKVTAGATGVMTWTMNGDAAEAYNGVIALRWDRSTFPPEEGKSQVMRIQIDD